MKCDKCKKQHWKGCCNDCKELEYCCYLCKDIVKVKDFNKHLGDHYANPNQYLKCNMYKVYKHIFFFLGLETEDADCASSLTDIHLAILKISLESMFIIIISAKLFHQSAKQTPPDRSSTMFHHL